MTLAPISSLRRLALLGAMALATAACSGGPTASTPVAASSAAPSVAASATAAAQAPGSEAPASAAPSVAAGACPTAAPPPMPAGQTATVTIKTAKGTFAIKVDGSLSPNAAGNFVALAECGFYTGVTFHRLVPGFVIQGGDPSGDGSGGPGYTIKDEPVKGEYKRGTVAMARTQAPDSQGSQFFIVLDDGARAALDSVRTYAIFGEVVSGMDVVDAIAAMPNSGEPANTALDPVKMEQVTVTRP